MKIKKMFFLLLLIASIIPLCIIILIFSLRFKAETRQLLFNNIEVVVQNEANKFEEFFKLRKANMDILCNIDITKTFLKASNTGTALVNQKIYADILNDMMASRITTLPYLSRMTLVNADNIVVAADNIELIGTKSMLNYDMSTVSENGQYLSPIETSENFYNGLPYCILTVPIYNEEIYQGYMLSVLFLNYFQKVIYESRFFTTSYITIVDELNHVVATTNPYLTDEKQGIIKLDNKILPKWDEVDIKTSPYGFITDIDSFVKSNRVVYHAPVEETNGWQIICSVGLNEITAGADQVLRDVVILTCAFFFLNLLIYYFLLQKIVLPINIILKAMKQLNSSAYMSPIICNTKNEIADIVFGFNTILKKVSVNEKNLEENEKAFLNLYNGLPCGIHKCKNLHPNFPLVYANKRLFEIIGYTEEEFDSIHKSEYPNIIYHEDAASIMEYIHTKTAYDRKPFDVTYRIVRKDGTIVQLYAVLQAIYEEEVEYVYSVIIDVANLKLDEKIHRII